MTRRRIDYLVAYDISDPRRLARVHRFLKEHAFPVQFSVFIAALDQNEIGAILAGLGRIIDARADDVRAYPLPSRPETMVIGRGHIFEGLVAPDLSLR